MLRILAGKILWLIVIASVFVSDSVLVDFVCTFECYDHLGKFIKI